MQPYTGETFALPNLDIGAAAPACVGQLMSKVQLEQLKADAATSDVAMYDLEAAIRSAAEHGPLVGVADGVAQAQRVGRRELDRRATRRKAAKRARKRNR